MRINSDHPSLNIKQILEEIEAEQSKTLHNMINKDESTDNKEMQALMDNDKVEQSGAKETVYYSEMVTDINDNNTYQRPKQNVNSLQQKQIKSANNTTQQRMPTSKNLKISDSEYTGIEVKINNYPKALTKFGDSISQENKNIETAQLIIVKNKGSGESNSTDDELTNFVRKSQPKSKEVKHINNGDSIKEDTINLKSKNLLAEKKSHTDVLPKKYVTLKDNNDKPSTINKEIIKSKYKNRSHGITIKNDTLQQPKESTLVFNNAKKEVLRSINNPLKYREIEINNNQGSKTPKTNIEFVKAQQPLITNAAIENYASVIGKKPKKNKNNITYMLTLVDNKYSNYLTVGAILGFSVGIVLFLFYVLLWK